MTLPPLAASDIPEEMLPFVDSFRFPTGVQIQRGTASSYGLVGWVVAVHPGATWLYADGVVSHRPDSRALETMELSDEQEAFKDGKTAVRFRQLNQYFSRLLVLPLAEAFRLASEHGYANRAAVQGETVVVREHGSDWDDKKAIVADPGADGSGAGAYVRLRFEDGDEQTFPLHRLLFSEIAA